MILFAIVKTDHRRDSEGIAGIERSGEHQHIHNDGNGCYAVSPTYFSIVQLNIIVTIPVTKAVAISELPFVAASHKVFLRHTGFTK